MRRLLSSLLVLSLGACGGDDDSGGGSVALADLGAALGAAHCGKAFECCTAAEIPMFYDGADFTDEPGCIEFYKSFFTALTPMYQASIDAGKVVYDADAAGTCVSALEALSCKEFASSHDVLQGRCPAPFKGQVVNGMPCASDNECKTGYCEGETQFGTPMDGVCKDLPTANQACTDFDCASGLTCDNDVCVPLKADGAACFDPDECMSGGCNGATQTQEGTCGVQMICNGQ